jgi:S-adenosylmethionine:tRNA ribosyltransferase-isomerase
MRTDDFDYELPDDLIAQTPRPRGESRLLVVDRRAEDVHHVGICDLPRFLGPDDVLLINDTRVVAARVGARRPTGRRFELLVLEPSEDGLWEGLVRPSARVRVGEALDLPDRGMVYPEQSLGEGRWRLRFDPQLTHERLDGMGETPLPPYIRRPEGATTADRERYQTVYAATPGAAAAPTAGLHFTNELLDAVASRGVEIVRLTLHVGLGTFRPVSVDRIEDHRMHEERFGFSADAAGAVNAALRENRRIVCCGTTSVRALEGALNHGDGVVRPGWDRTDLFITPGYRFRGVGALLTNYHLPRSTLLMLVSALAGRERILAAYREAVEHRYRFFSYGDAMLIL